MKQFWKLAGATLLAAAFAPAGAAGAPGFDHQPAPKRAFELPPSADLAYSISARQRGFNLNGDAVMTWRAGDGKYTITTESRVALLGKLTEGRSHGTIDAWGLAPGEYTEKRFRKEPTTSTFDRGAKTIRFTEGDETYPIRGGEQDRMTVAWQLASIARAAKDKFKPGSEWTFFVVGWHDAEPWTFRVVGREKVRAGAAIGEVEAVHILREPPDEKAQSLDLWLAPSQEWYPVKLRFTESNRDFVEQTLERVTKK